MEILAARRSTGYGWAAVIMELRIEGLSKRYPSGVQALSDVSLTIGPGMFGLLGPNGAGKSSLMRTIATLQEPDSGSVRLGGLDVLRQKDERVRFHNLLAEIGVLDEAEPGEGSRRRRRISRTCISRRSRARGRDGGARHRALRGLEAPRDDLHVRVLRRVLCHCGVLRARGGRGHRGRGRRAWHRRQGVCQLALLAVHDRGADRPLRIGPEIRGAYLQPYLVVLLPNLVLAISSP